jgi:nucleoside-diphosphate-sugar epimerase
MMQWTGRRVLVTGAAGVIGRVLVRDLVSRGAKVLCVDVASDDAWSSGVVQYVQANLARGVPPEVCAFDPEVVFHLAATFERTEEAPGYWKTSFENNVLLSHLLLKALVPGPSLEIFVFASSYLVYNPEQYLNAPCPYPLKETDPIAPRNLVGLAKYFTERELDFIQKTEHKFRPVSARIFRVYGRDSRDVISRWVRAGLRKELIEVHGRKNRFDYIFADDVAQGLIRLAESEVAQGVINLGSGVARSIDDVVAILRTELDDLQVQDRQSDDAVEASCADMSLFHRITGWLPSTSLEQGIKQVILYERQRSQQ